MISILDNNSIASMSHKDFFEYLTHLDSQSLYGVLHLPIFSPDRVRHFSGKNGVRYVDYMRTDEEQGKYFKIQPNHLAPKGARYSTSGVKRENEAKKVAESDIWRFFAHTIRNARETRNSRLDLRNQESDDRGYCTMPSVVQLLSIGKLAARRLAGYVALVLSGLQDHSNLHP